MPSGRMATSGRWRSTSGCSVKMDSKSQILGYFVYCNGDAGQPAFNAKLEFDIKLIPYRGNPDWVEATIVNLHKCLVSKELPTPGVDCDYCAYFEKRAMHEHDFKD